MAKIARVFLTTSIVLLLLSCQGAGRGPQYTIAGNIELVNDCDGQPGALPATVTVRAWLNDSAGDGSVNAVEGSTGAAVAPDPADPPGTPRKIGTYSITVSWNPALGNPPNWNAPVATRYGGKDVCEPIACPAPGGRCLNKATRPRLVQRPRVDSLDPTSYNIKVRCSCVGS